MRHYLVTLLALITISGMAQVVPNGSFENWEMRDHYKLDGWFTPTLNVHRTTDAKVGNYALKLVNQYNPNNNGTTGYARNIDYGNLSELNGFAFDGDPLSLVFWSKHDLPPGDEARIYCVFRDHGTQKGAVDFRFTGSTADTFVRYSVPITWSGSRTPDSVWVYLYSYGSESRVERDGYVIFDDIHFDKIGERMPDITNADFEDWTNIGIEYPEGWVSYDLLIYDLYTSFLATRTSGRVTDDVVDGNSAWMVSSYLSGSNPRYSYHFTGEENGDYSRPIFAFTDTFRYLQGYYKYFPDGDDSAYVVMRAMKGTSTRSYNTLRLPATSEWTFFTIPLTYNASVMPDSGTILFYSAVNDTLKGPNSTLYLDGLDLVREPQSASIRSLDETTHVYPNPTHDNLTVILEHNAKATIINTMGQTVKQQELMAGQNRIDLRDHPTGIYHLKLNTKSKQWTIKIMKQ